MLTEIRRESDSLGFAADEIFYYGFEVTHLPTALTWKRWERYSSLKNLHARLAKFIEGNGQNFGLKEVVSIDELGRLSVSLDSSGTSLLVGG